jgi:tRNA pseudouridine55 synthase
MENGAVLLDKAPGMSSFGALSPLKRAHNTRRVGHTGTLDPFASGLLIALVGKMTRLADYVTGQDKEYEAIFRFGEETDTLDTEGAVEQQCRVPDEETLRGVLPSFLGTIEQRPPRFSAVHLDGVRAHQLARAGKEVEMPSRLVRVTDLETLSWQPPELKLRVACSKGTYIRSLARDIGRACGSCAYVTELRRTRIGAYSVSDAVSPDDAAEGEGLLSPREFLALGGGIPELSVRPGSAGRIKNGAPIGQQIVETAPKEGLFAVIDDGEILALCRSDAGELSYLVVL